MEEDSFITLKLSKIRKTSTEQILNNAYLPSSDFTSCALTPSELKLLNLSKLGIVVVNEDVCGERAVVENGMAEEVSSSFGLVSVFLTLENGDSANLSLNLNWVS